MYKVLKSAGNNENIRLVNSETHAEINLGKLTPGIIRLLEKDGYTFVSDEHPDGLKYKQEWELNIREETKDELQRLAMVMHKPSPKEKHKEEKYTETEQPKEKVKKQPVDVFNLIFGTD